jgi:glyoxylase-like metal-dependent hydrolase (beta-lactamase superfamily II)
VTSSNDPKLIDGIFPGHWIDGTVPDEPVLQVHRYCKDTWILRQSVHTHFEAPFLYLFAGEDRALLLDTGAGSGLPVRETIDRLIGARFPLIVAHTHAHGDHIAHDGQFADRPDTVIVGHAPEDVARFFSIDHWPETTATYNLGRREVDVIPSPGHERASITTYDRLTGMLVTGDSVYPGRLYVFDFPAFRASIDRVADFAANHEIACVMGTHIEMSKEPGVDYERGAPTHPNEHQLQLGTGHLLELRDALHAMGEEMRYEIHDDFIVYPR